jgi:hypothetical protein
MSQNKEGTEGSEKKPGVKIQDLSPKKDAKGGGGRGLDGGGFAASGGGTNQSGGGMNQSGGGKNQDSGQANN